MATEAGEASAVMEAVRAAAGGEPMAMHSAEAAMMAADG